MGPTEASETLTSSYVVAGEVKASAVNCVHPIVHLACFNQPAFLGHEDSLVLKGFKCSALTVVLLPNGAETKEDNFPAVPNST